MNQPAHPVRASLREIGVSPGVATGNERVRLDRQAGVHVVRGRRALLDAQPVLQALAARCGQTGEADSLAQLVEVPGAVKKKPWLVLLGEDRSAPAAAVWAFEYRLGPLGTRVFASADGTGRRNVLAAAADRAWVAAVAAQILMGRGGQVVHLAFNEEHWDGCAGDGAGACEPPGEDHALQTLARVFDGHEHVGQQWSFERLTVPMYLPLLATFDATLARIGQKTRANLRYYRRRCEHDLGCRYEAAVRIGEEDFVALNLRCRYPVHESTARKRYGRMQLPGTFLAGVRAGTRDGAGEWMALVGGRRQNGVIEIDWQMNRADLPQYSLSTVMRSYLLEAEIARGTRRLYIEGGTPNPIQRSFVNETVCELTLRRRSAYVRTLGRLGRAVFPERNYVGQILLRDDVLWREVRV